MHIWLAIPFSLFTLYIYDKPLLRAKGIPKVVPAAKRLTQCKNKNIIRRVFGESFILIKFMQNYTNGNSK